MKEISRKIRRRTIKLLYDHQKCHLGSNMSAIEILVALFFSAMEDNDEFVASKGWIAASLYSVLAEKGIIPEEKLDYYFRKHNLVSPDVPGIKFGTGSGGQGLPVSIGMAMANRDRRVFCLMGDGEIQEGTTWEAMWFAAKHNIDNLVVIVDWNGWQAFGDTRMVSGISPEKIYKVFREMGWRGEITDGHDLALLGAAMSKNTPGAPKVIICKTIKGKGVPAYENKLESHYYNLTKDQYEEAIRKLPD